MAMIIRARARLCFWTKYLALTLSGLAQSRMLALGFRRNPLAFAPKALVSSSWTSPLQL